MKKFLGIMAGIFLVLAIIFYANSIRSVGYGSSSMEVANIQMTVFAAASAVLCGINFVGALLSYKIDNVNDSQIYYLDKKITSESKNAPSGSMLSRAVNSIEQEKKRNEWVCICGAKNSSSAAYCYRCRRSKNEMDTSKVTCPHCGAQNRLTNTVCFACNQPLAKED